MQGPFELSLAVSIHPPLLKVPERLPDATIGETYSYIFCNPPSNTGLECGRSPISTNPSSGIPPYTFSASNLPLGLSIAFNGVLSGKIPVGYREGEREFEICAKDSRLVVTCEKTILPLVLPKEPFLNETLPPASPFLNETLPTTSPFLNETQLTKLSFTLPTALPSTTIGVEFVYDFCEPSSYNSINCGKLPSSTNPSGGTPPYTFLPFISAPRAISMKPNGVFTAAFVKGQEDTYDFNICIEDSAKQRACATTSLAVIPKISPAPSPEPSPPTVVPPSIPTGCEYSDLCDKYFSGSKYSGGHYACYYPQSVFNVFKDCPREADGNLIPLGDCCRQTYPGFNFNTANAVCMASSDTMSDKQQECSS